LAIKRKVERFFAVASPARLSAAFARNRYLVSGNRKGLGIDYGSARLVGNERNRFFLDHDARSYELISRVFQGQAEGPTRDDILDNITITWLKNTALSGARLYWENWGKLGYFNAKGVSIPVAVSDFPDELYPTWEQPQLFSEEVRAGLGPLRHRLQTAA
jgi:hypothetical protein